MEWPKTICQNADKKKSCKREQKNIEQLMQRTMATVALTHMHCGSSKLPLKGFQSLHATSSEWRIIFPNKNGMQPSGTRSMHSSCSMYAHSMRWQSITGRSIRSFIITSRVQLHSFLERQSARVRGGDEPQRHRERQRGAQRNDQGMKLWRVIYPGLDDVHVQNITKQCCRKRASRTGWIGTCRRGWGTAR